MKTKTDTAGMEKTREGVNEGEGGIRPALLNVGQVGKLIGCSERHIWKLLASGQIPSPVRLGKSVRWPVDQLRGWIAAGCPGN